MRNTIGSTEGKRGPMERIRDELNFHWLRPGKAAGCARPACEEEVDFLYQQGILGILNVADDILLPGWLNRGFTCEAVGIEDGHAPSRERALRVLYLLSSWRQSDLCFAVHCGSGRGRTGTILAFYLMAFEGMDFPEAYREVRGVFPAYIETSSQTKFLSEQAPYLIAEWNLGH